MPTVSLPDRPDLAQLRRQARELQRGVRAGDAGATAHVTDHRAPVPPGPEFPLSAAQLVIARHYGFSSWPRLVEFVDMKAHYTRTPGSRPAGDDPADEFLRRACLTYADDGPQHWRAARDLLDAQPAIARASVLHTAALADADGTRAFLTSDASLARRQGGPFRWEPLFVLAYSRVVPDVDERAVLETARLLLAHGADPNAGYLWWGLPTPFTVLTGIFGEGELGPVRQPRHAHALAFARVVLDAGADPNDGQTLYNRMFEPDDSHLELLFEYGLGTGSGGPWRFRLGEALDSPPRMLRGQLEWAVLHGMQARVELLVEHGADVASPLGDGRTIAQLAAVNGHRELAAFLTAHGAPASAPIDPVDDLLGAALAADREHVERLRATDPTLLDAAHARRPSIMVWAAAQRRGASIPFLAELGFDVDARGRGDIGSDEPWETPLHRAVANDDAETVEVLLALGADPNLHDARFDSTPLGWAHYFGHTALAERLAAITTQEAS